MKYFITWIIMSAVVSYSKTYNPHYKTTEDKFGRKHSIFVVDSVVKTDTVYSGITPKKKYFGKLDSAYSFYKEIVVEAKKPWTWQGADGSMVFCHADGTPLDRYQGEDRMNDYINIICCIKMGIVKIWASKRR